MRIKDDEWNIYRRYSQFFEMHKTVSVMPSLFAEGLILNFTVHAILPYSNIVFSITRHRIRHRFQLFPTGNSAKWNKTVMV